jgi:hypothetical protein
MKRPKRRPGIIGNTHHTVCDRCGMAYNVENTLIEKRTGLLVCTWCHNDPHPADDPHYTTERDFPDPSKVRKGDFNE